MGSLNIRCIQVPPSTGAAYQILNLETVLVPQHAAGDVSRARVDICAAEVTVDEGSVADGAPATVMENLQAAILSAAIGCHGSIAQPQVTFRCKK